MGAAGGEEVSGMSDSEANLSEYEEQIRRNRGLPEPDTESQTGSSSIPISSSRLRKNSSTSTPAVSPRPANPFLDQGDYGIRLDDDEAHDPKDYILTTDLISKASSQIYSLIIHMLI